MKLVIIAGSIALLMLGTYYVRSRYFAYAYEPLDNSVQTKNIPPMALLPWNNELNLMQGSHMCAGYAVMAVEYVLRNGVLDPRKTFASLGGKFFGKGVLPFGLEDELVQKGYTIERPFLEAYTDVQKVDFLEYALSKASPVILLIEEDGPHYITLLGYDKEKKELYVYDSYLGYDKDVAKESTAKTPDKNGETLPGNQTYTYEELLSAWKGGGRYGLYKYYSLIVRK